MKPAHKARPEDDRAGEGDGGDGDGGGGGGGESVTQLTRRLGSPAEQDIDRLYGLEPRFEPGDTHGALGDYVEYLCPWCCENIGTSVDLVGGDRSYIEDCQVCCQPIEIGLTVDERGALRELTATRAE